VDQRPEVPSLADEVPNLKETEDEAQRLKALEQGNARLGQMPCWRAVASGVPGTRNDTGVIAWRPKLEPTLPRGLETPWGGRGGAARDGELDREHAAAARAEARGRRDVAGAGEAPRGERAGAAGSSGRPW
jgi:hypothetical protein